jgi:hypothetical protein
MILHLLRLRPVRPLSKPNIQIRARAKYPTRTRHNDTFDALVDVEHGICSLNLLAHFIRERIVIFRAVEREDNHAGFLLMVARLDLREL